MSDTTEPITPQASILLATSRKPISVEPCNDSDKPLAERRIVVNIGDVSVYVTQPNAKLLAAELLAAAVRVQWAYDLGDAADSIPSTLVADVLGGGPTPLHPLTFGDGDAA